MNLLKGGDQTVSVQKKRPAAHRQPVSFWGMNQEVHPNVTGLAAQASSGSSSSSSSMVTIGSTTAKRVFSDSVSRMNWPP